MENSPIWNLFAGLAMLLFVLTLMLISEKYYAPKIEYREVENRIESACNRLSGNLQCIVENREHFIILPD